MWMNGVMLALSLTRYRVNTRLARQSKPCILHILMNDNLNCWNLWNVKLALSRLCSLRSDMSGRPFWKVTWRTCQRWFCEMYLGPNHVHPCSLAFTIVWKVHVCLILLQEIVILFCWSVALALENIEVAWTVYMPLIVLWWVHLAGPWLAVLISLIQILQD